MVKLAAVLKVKVKLLSHVRLFATPWTVTYQSLQAMEFSRQESWSGLPFCVLLFFYDAKEIVACQVPLSIGFPRQEYWSEWPFPSPGDLSDPRIKSISHYVSCIGKWVLYH